MVLAVVWLLFMPTAAAAEWWEAETDHFVVLSESSRSEASEMAVKLERFDEALRFLHNVEPEHNSLPRSAKLTLYHYGSPDDIGYLYAGAPSAIAGFFIPRAGDSVAFVPRRKESIRDAQSRIGRASRYTLDPQVVLFHEYAHYFMYQHAPAAYPAWYREGSAEVYGTLMLTDDGFRLGEPAVHRSNVLTYWSRYPVRRLLDRTREFNGKDGAQVYALGWLLAHYLTFSPERPGQLGTYLALINQGQSSIAAAEQAFGDLDELDRELNRYGQGKMPVIDVRHENYAPPVATVRKLDEDEAARMDLAIQLASGLKPERAAKLVGEAQKLQARYPESVAVQLTAATAEFQAEQYEDAGRAASRVLELDPSNARAHLLLGQVALRRAETDPAQFAQARTHFATVSRLEPGQPEAFVGYYRSYVDEGTDPPEDARLALEQAYDSAKFDDETRILLAQLYVTEDRPTEAIALVDPILNNPHAGKAIEPLRKAVALIDEGKTEEALAAFAAFDSKAEDEGDDGDDGDGNGGDDEGSGDDE